MPTLPNPSGYDRDSRKFVGKVESSLATQTVVADKPVVSLAQLEQDMVTWMQSQDKFPAPHLVREKYQALSGVRLGDNELRELLLKLGLKP